MLKKPDNRVSAAAVIVVALVVMFWWRHAIAPYIDLVLYIALGLVTVCMTVWSAIVSVKSLPEGEPRLPHIAGLVGMGVLSVFLIIVIGIRNSTQQTASAREFSELRRRLNNMPKAPTAQENAQAVVELERKQPSQEVAKQVLPPRRNTGKPKAAQPTPARPAEEDKPSPSTPSNPPVQASAAQLTITQQPDVSTRKDAPFLTRVTIQTTAEFPTLKLALRCSGPITEGIAGIGNGMSSMSMSGEGVVAGHPDVFVITYESATPRFSPSAPMIISLWSQQPIQCREATTF